MSYIVQSGSKQYVVEAGQKFAVDRLESTVGEVINLPVILAFGADKETSELKVKVLEHGKGEKIRVVKYKPKSNYHRQYGFRPYLTVLEVVGDKAPALTKEDAIKKPAVAKKVAVKKEKKEVKTTTSKPKVAKK